MVPALSITTEHYFTAPDWGHGDAMHIANLDPDRPGYQVWEVHEEKEACQTYGYEMHDARTGEILWGGPNQRR